MPSNQGQ